MQQAFGAIFGQGMLMIVASLSAFLLAQLADVVAFRIMRTNGLEAFKDNETIHKVNEVRGDEDFVPRDQEATVRILEPDDARLGEALRDRRHLLYYGEATDQRTLTFLWPILNDEKCHKCHGKVDPVRGVLELTTSLAAVDDQIRRTWLQAGLIMAIRRAITSTLAAPKTPDTAWICRLTLDSATMSRSTSVSAPTAERASASATQEPTPPMPMSQTCAAAKASAAVSP